MQVKDVKQFFLDSYKILSPNSYMINIAQEVFDHYKKTDDSIKKNLKALENLTVENIASGYEKRREQFFHEIVKVAGKIIRKDQNMEYCLFIMDDYTFQAKSAEDGDLVIIDESFFRILGILIIIFVFDVHDLIQDNEKYNIILLVKKIVDDYINHRVFNRYDEDGDITKLSLIKKNYEVCEIATNFWKSIQIFIIAHEISHHILHHTKNTPKRNNEENEDSAAAKKDKFDELDADILGYKIYLEVLNTTDDSIDIANCKIKFEYAPLFLFDLFSKLDKLKGKRSINYVTHPKPIERKNNLLKHYKIKGNSSNFYKNLRKTLKSYL